MDLKQHIRSVPDFPKPGILFYDISTLLAHPVAWRTTVHRLTEALQIHEPDQLVGIESRGFLVAAPLAYAISDDGVKRIAVARQARIAAIDVTPIAGLGKIPPDQAQMPVIVEQPPASDRLCVETAVREGNDQRRPRTQHPPHFAQHLDR